MEMDGDGPLYLSAYRVQKNYLHLLKMIIEKEINHVYLPINDTVGNNNKYCLLSHHYYMTYLPRI